MCPMGYLPSQAYSRSHSNSEVGRVAYQVPYQGFTFYRRRKGGRICEMAQFISSKEKLEISEGYQESVPRKRWHIVLGLCAIFAILSLVFIILYATEANKAEPVTNSGGTGGTCSDFCCHILYGYFIV